MSYGGSSGSGSISGASDAALSNPTNGQVLTYTSSTQKWTNQTPTGTISSVDWEGSLGFVLLDNFSGSTDDARLTAAMSYASAQTHPPVIKLANQSYTFSTAQTLYDGFKLEGVQGYANAEKSNANMGTTCTISTSGVWLSGKSSGNTFDVYVGQIAFKGTSSTQFMGSAGSGFYCIMLRDLSFSGFKSVLGSQATRFVGTAMQFDGYWEVNNSYNGAFHLTGSDNALWPDGMLLDSSTTYNSSGSANGQYHLWFDYCEKTTIGPLYITCEGGWGGVLVSGPAYNAGGSNMGGPIVIAGARIEGRNAGAPCNGANVRVEGGILILRDCWISYGMASPVSFGNSPTDGGVIHCTSGKVLVAGCTYDHATSVAASVPFIYTSGTGSARARDIFVGSKGGTWSSLPVATDASSGTIVIDDTMTN